MPDSHTSRSDDYGTAAAAKSAIDVNVASGRASLGGVAPPP